MCRCLLTAQCRAGSPACSGYDSDVPFVRESLVCRVVPNSIGTKLNVCAHMQRTIPCLTYYLHVKYLQMNERTSDEGELVHT